MTWGMPSSPSRRAAGGLRVARRAGGNRHVKPWLGQSSSAVSPTPPNGANPRRTEINHVAVENSSAQGRPVQIQRETQLGSVNFWAAPWPTTGYPAAPAPAGLQRPARSAAITLRMVWGGVVVGWNRRPAAAGPSTLTNLGLPPVSDSSSSRWR